MLQELQDRLDQVSMMDDSMDSTKVDRKRNASESYGPSYRGDFLHACDSLPRPKPKQLIRIQQEELLHTKTSRYAAVAEKGMPILPVRNLPDRAQAIYDSNDMDLISSSSVTSFPGIRQGFPLFSQSAAHTPEVSHPFSLPYLCEPAEMWRASLPEVRSASPPQPEMWRQPLPEVTSPDVVEMPQFALLQTCLGGGLPLLDGKENDTLARSVEVSRYISRAKRKQLVAIQEEGARQTKMARLDVDILDKSADISTDIDISFALPDVVGGHRSMPSLVSS